MIEPQLMRYRPATVEVMQLQPGNETYVATWCGGVVAADRVWLLDNEAQPHIAHQGDWVVRDPYGEYRVVRDSRMWAVLESIVGPVMAE
jgi:hypothetical protein